MVTNHQDGNIYRSTTGGPEQQHRDPTKTNLLSPLRFAQNQSLQERIVLGRQLRLLQLSAHFFSLRQDLDLRGRRGLCLAFRGGSVALRGGRKRRCQGHQSSIAFVSHGWYAIPGYVDSVQPPVGRRMVHQHGS